MQPINTNLKFVELVNPIYKQKGKAIQVIVGVEYLDELSKTTSVFSID